MAQAFVDYIARMAYAWYWWTDLIAHLPFPIWIALLVIALMWFFSHDHPHTHNK